MSCHSPTILEKSNMILLSREATENDHSLKTKLRHASNMTESETNG